MIRTSQKPLEELLRLIPAQAQVGILGCGDCASVLNTGGSRQVGEMADRLAGRNPVVFQAMVDAPCDQRVLRRMLGFIPRFDEAGVVLVLACPAGVQSLGDLLLREGKGRVAAAGLTASGLGLITSKGVRQEACIFCESCNFDPRLGLCPTARCPLRKRDGPCQTRLSEDRCTVSPETRCLWIEAPIAGKEPP